MNSMKRQKDITSEDGPHRSVGVQYATGKRGEIAPKRMKRLSQSGNDAQLLMCLVMKIKSDAIKNSTA